MLDEATLAEYGVSAAQRRALSDYVTLLLKWNKHINLISKQSQHEVWDRHILDCLQLSTYLPKDKNIRVLDVGSGAGLPAIVLAIMGYSVTAVDSDQRKIAFIHEAARHCGCASLNAVCERIENLSTPPVDVITARALAPINEILRLTESLRKADTRYLLLKGKNTEQEIALAKENWQMTEQQYASKVSDSDGWVVTLSGVMKL